MGNNAVITVRIDGKNIRAGASGLAFYPGSANSALRGVAITGFNAHGAFLLGAPSPVGPGTHGVTIAGNFIGTDGSGVGDDTSGLLANGASGVRIANYAHENLVGGATPADRNLIVASSSGAGISIDGVYNTQIRNNHIGTNRSGSSRRNTLVSVEIAGPYTVISNNVVGALETGISIHGGGVGLVMQGNLISVGTTGISIADATSSHGIHIHSIDTGHQQRCRYVGELRVFRRRQWHYRIEVFSNAACDPSSYGEGQTFLGSAGHRDRRGHVRGRCPATSRASRQPSDDDGHT